MQDNVFFAVPFDAPPGTQLYPVGLIAPGTSEVEAADSWLLRLAHAHRVVPGNILELVHTRLLTPGEQVWLRTNPELVELLHRYRKTDIWIRALAQATGQSNLRLGTMACFRKLFGKTALMHLRPRVCVHCILEDLACGREPYGRLIWWFAAVRCCHIHAITLVETERPERRFTSGRVFQHYGACVRCQTVGHDCLASKVQPATAYDLQVALAVADLIAHQEELELVSLGSMKKAIKDRFREEPGRLNQFRFNVYGALQAWLACEPRTLALPRFMAIASTLGVTPLQLVRGDTGSAFHLSGQELRTRYRRYDKVQLTTAMLEGLAAQRHPKGLARELGISRTTMRLHNSQLLDCMVAAAASAKRLRIDQKMAGAIATAKDAMLTMLRQNASITLGNGVRLGLQGAGSFYATQALERLRRKLGISPSTSKADFFAPAWDAEFDAAAAAIRSEATALGRSALLQPFRSMS